jgi:hypothetical protein
MGTTTTQDAISDTKVHMRVKHLNNLDCNILFYGNVGVEFCPDDWSGIWGYILIV